MAKDQERPREGDYPPGLLYRLKSDMEYDNLNHVAHVLRKNCDCCRSFKQMPETDQTTDFTLHLFLSYHFIQAFIMV